MDIPYFVVEKGDKNLNIHLVKIVYFNFFKIIKHWKAL